MSSYECNRGGCRWWVIGSPKAIARATAEHEDEQHPEQLRAALDQIKTTLSNLHRETA